MLHRFPHRRGFTLVELMIVVAIVGVGGTIAVVNMSEQVGETRARADGQAMLERIRQEQRESKERMTGMVLHATDEGGGGGGGGSQKNVLVFQDARDCVAFGAPRTAEFFKTTALEISDTGTVCWNEHGEPAAAGGRGGNGGGWETPPTRDGPGVVAPSPPPPELGEALIADMTIKTGIKNIERKRVYVSHAGVSSTPPLKGRGRAHQKNGPPRSPRNPRNNDQDLDSL